MSTELFAERWADLVQRWRDTPTTERTAVLQEALDHGLRQDVGDVLDADELLGSAAARECEEALLRLSGLVDEAGYLGANPDVVAARMDPVRHFSRHGWRTMRNPSLDFDLWWYWAEHLDPAQDRVDPLVHYAVEGRRAGLSTTPPGTPLRGVDLPTDREVRRVCLFAGFDRDGLMDDAVVAYVAELSRFADVYYLADCHMEEAELARLAPYTKGAWAHRHGDHDFGSYSLLARELVGWDTIEGYDELLLVNDSCFLLRPLDETFARMGARTSAWWGMQLTSRAFDGRSGRSDEVAALSLDEVKRTRLPRAAFRYTDYVHVGSSFLVYRRPVIDDPGFRRRLDSVVRQASTLNVSYKYETGMTQYLAGTGHDFDTVADALHPDHPVHGLGAFEMIAGGLPLLRRRILSDNPDDTPDLADWKDRILALVPDAPVEMLDRSLQRTAPADRLHRSFSIRTAANGKVLVPRLLTNAEFVEEDRWAPKFDHWWAFPVCGYDHTFAGNDRAVFEEVRQDPSVKKIVLTRSRRIDVDGENVVVVPLQSPEGQHYLLRARQVFLKHSPPRNAMFPLSPALHNLVNLWHGIPLKKFGYASVESLPARRALMALHRPCRAVITSSRFDTLAMTAAFHPLTYDAMWPTGLPRNDFIVRDARLLPADLREQELRLRELVGDRRLVLFAPTFKDAQAAGYYRFSEQELSWLADWCERENVVLGVREHMADSARTYSRAFARLGALNLSSQLFPDIEMIFRVAAALITDYSSCAVDFLLTGRPVVSFAYDYDHYVNEERGLFYDLEQVLPGPVCRDFDRFSQALDGLFEPLDGRARRRYDQRRRLFFDHLDDHNAWRVVQRVKGLYRLGDGAGAVGPTAGEYPNAAKSSA